MTSGYYLNTDGSGNLGFFLLLSGAELMYLNSAGNLSVDGVITSGNKITYTSGSGTFIVPSGISMLKVYLIGAGGDGGDPSNNNGYPGNNGGDGAIIIYMS